MDKHKDLDDYAPYVLRIASWEENQRYKAGNKNYGNDQPWFKFHARKLLANIDFMSLEPGQRDFLVLLWAVASADNGYLPDNKTLAFRLRRDLGSTEAFLSFFIENKWVLEVSRAKYMSDSGIDFINPNTARETEDEIHF